MRAVASRWTARIVLLAGPVFLAGCHGDDDVSSAGVVDIVYAVGDVVLAILAAVSRYF